MHKVFIVGLDGATFDLIRPWAEEGKLPTLRRLMDEGAWGPLESTIPPMTSPAWPSFATGKYPGKHGVFDFVSAHSGTFNIVNATSLDALPLWDILSDLGKRVNVLNVPVTYPPHPLNGIMVTCLLSPSTGRITSPDDLLDRYENQLGPEMPRYRVMPSIQYKPGHEEAFLHDLESLIDTRAKYASRFMRDFPWDFMMIHFLAADLAQHSLWQHMDPAHPRHKEGNPFQNAIQRIYQRVDLSLGKLLSQLGDDTTVIVMSDHGFGALHGVVNLNILLLEKGLLHLKRDPLTQLRAFMFRHGLTPANAYQLLSRLNLQNIVSRVSKSTRNAVFNRFLSFDDIDWSRTVAYSLGHMGQIYINVKGRERHGIVERNGETERAPQYEHVCEQVISALNSLVTTDGRSMVDKVIRKETISFGKHADEGPDLHVVLDGYRYISCPLFATDGNVLSKQIRGDSGCHRSHGIFIAHGPLIRAGHIANTRIVDLAPTTLELMGCALPGDMDGRVLADIFKDPRIDVPPLQAEPVALPTRQGRYALTEDEEAELETRLKGLGYLG